MRYYVWDRLAPRYNTQWVQKYSLGPTRREVKKILVPLLRENSSLRILDIGCGTGQLISDICAEVRVDNYLGIDAAENMIKIATESHDSRLKFMLCPIEKFETDEKFDIVICTHSFPYFPHKEEALAKINSMCNNNAVLIIVNSSTNTLYDFLINLSLKLHTSEAEYLSIKKTKKLLTAVGFDVNDVHVIRERIYMPTIALFYARKIR